MSETLVVVSKVKKHIKDQGDMNCSANVMPKLSEIVERECARAIENARKDRRKTVMDRDFN